MITVSIVSHNHGQMINALLHRISSFSEVTRIVLTINAPEKIEPSIPEALTNRIILLRNKIPKGFGSNHNTAFGYCNTPYYCILNPDIYLDINPFPTLLNCLNKHTTSALCAPAILSPAGNIEDNARYFPSILNLLLKLFGINDGRYQYEKGDLPFHPDWIAGMFMLFTANDYDAVNGFDESYFLYYEDVDLCSRLQHAGRKTVLCPQTSAVHNAQRASHHNLQHMRWHLTSMFRYLWQHRS